MKTPVARRRLRGMLLATVIAFSAADADAPGAAVVTSDPGLSVLSAGEYRSWWNVESAPKRWARALPLVRDAVAWRTARPGMDWGEILVSGPGEARRTRVVLVRVDPTYYEFRLDISVHFNGEGNQWSIDSVTDRAVLAFSAGQFFGLTPWGWLVHDSRELRPAGKGPLAIVVAFDRVGRVHMLEDGGPSAEPGVALPQEAFQSYPALLVHDGEVPPQILRPHPDLRWGHRDARFAIGLLRDGRLLLALTRFNGLGPALESLPLGLTVPEMSAVMGALGCRTAVMLDGGLSGQLTFRDRLGEQHRWPGWRKVPVGIVVMPRAGGAT